MKILGFRVEPDTVHCAVVEGTREAPVLSGKDKAVAPKTYSEAKALSWFRERALLLMSQHKPSRVVVRYPEPNARLARTDNVKRRFRIEGVVLEAAASKAIEVETPTLVTLSAQLGSKAKQALDEDDLRGLDWSSCPENLREAILAAASYLPSDSASDGDE